MLNRILHRIAEMSGWNTGTVETWWENGVLMVGFRCSCGKLMCRDAAIERIPR